MHWKLHFKFTWGVFDDTTSCSMEVSMNIDVTWESIEQVINQILTVFIFQVCRSFLTSPEVPFNDHLVLLLVPSCDDEIVLGADEPQELFKPAKREQTVKADSTDQAHYKVPTHTHPCLTSRLSWPSEWWSLSGLLSGSAVFFSQLISWPLVTLS